MSTTTKEKIALPLAVAASILLVIAAMLALKYSYMSEPWSPPITASSSVAPSSTTTTKSESFDLKKTCDSQTFDMSNDLGRYIARFCKLAQHIGTNDPMGLLMLEINKYKSGDENVSDLAKWTYNHTR